MRLLGQPPSPEYRGRPLRFLYHRSTIQKHIEIDERKIQPEVVSCQIGHRDMEVGVQGARDYYRGEVVPRYEFWLPPFGGCAVYYWDRPKAD